jgi:hypothetical protein
MSTSSLVIPYFSNRAGVAIAGPMPSHTMEAVKILGLDLQEKKRTHIFWRTALDDCPHKSPDRLEA